MSERALVLGGGGSAGNAWLIGVVAGLADAGLDVTDADLVIGTSAARRPRPMSPVRGRPSCWPASSDGGYRRNENADLAAGYERVLVLSPLGGRTRHPLGWGMQLAAQVDELRTGGSAVEAIVPDADSLNAFGTDVMDPSTRRPAALAGYALGRGRAERLTQLWH